MSRRNSTNAKIRSRSPVLVDETVCETRVAKAGPPMLDAFGRSFATPVRSSTGRASSRGPLGRAGRCATRRARTVVGDVLGDSTCEKSAAAASADALSVVLTPKSRGSPR